MIRFFRKKKTDCLLKRDVTAEVMSYWKGLKGLKSLKSLEGLKSLKGLKGLKGLKSLKGLGFGLWKLDEKSWLVGPPPVSGGVRGGTFSFNKIP
jgi:hypothetical protein